MAWRKYKSIFNWRMVVGAILLLPFALAVIFALYAPVFELLKTDFWVAAKVIITMGAFVTGIYFWIEGIVEKRHGVEK